MAASTVPILFVEDNSDLADMLKDFLASFGFEAVTAGSPSEALTIAPSLHPKIFILDIGLPEMDGYQLGRKLKNLFPESIFVAHSAWTRNETRQKDTQFSFDYFFTKPNQIMDMAKTVQSIAGH